MADQIMPPCLALPSDPDEAERHLIAKIRELQEEYQMRIAPYAQMLVCLRNLRPAPPFYITAEQYEAFIKKPQEEAGHV
jgi:hypothetical protein